MLGGLPDDVRVVTGGEARAVAGRQRAARHERLPQIDRRLRRDVDGLAVPLGRPQPGLDEAVLHQQDAVALDAELEAAPLQRGEHDDPVLFAEIEAQYRARRQAYRDALEAEGALLAKAEQDLRVAQETEQKLGKTLPIYRQQAEGWETLAREGYAGKLMALERQRLYLENAQDLKAQSHNIEGLRASIAQSVTRKAQITSNYRQQLHNERVEAEAQRHRAQQELDKQRHRSSLLELKAPQAGIVKDLATHTPGTVVAPGAILLTLVPRDEPLVAEVWINNADAGFVHSGQRARVKIATFPFQKYGVDGTVLKEPLPQR